MAGMKKGLPKQTVKNVGGNAKPGKGGGKKSSGKC